MYPSLSAQTSKRGWIIKNEDQAYNLPRKSIIVYKKNENSEFTNSIGRIIGLPGEIVEIIDSQTYINGEFLSEPYVTWSGKNKNLDKIQVNNDEVLVMYDNRSTFPVHTSLVPLKSIEAHFGTIVVESEN
jgi:signal peptidase I